MEAILLFIRRHAYAVLFGAVFSDQIGLPLPALPILLGIGSLSAQGHLSFRTSLLLGMLASLLADAIWYALGRLKGHSILRLMCRLSLEPDNCVRRTQQVFGRHGAWVLIYAKFVPALSTVAPPMAGAIRLPLARFLLCDGLGAFIWMGVFTGLGYIFSDEMDKAVWLAARFGTGMLILLLAVVAGWLLYKVYQRRAYLRKTHVARVTPEELNRKLQQGETVAVIDLRHKLGLDAERVRLPGAVHIPPEELETRLEEIPRDGDLVLYCT